MFYELLNKIKPLAAGIGLGALRAKPDIALSIFPSLRDYFKSIERLEINTEKKEIVTSAMLQGETEAIDLKIQYEIEEENGKSYLKVINGDASIDWMTALIKNIVIKQRFVVPEEYSGVVLALK